MVYQWGEGDGGGVFADVAGTYNVVTKYITVPLTTEHTKTYP